MSPLPNAVIAGGIALLTADPALSSRCEMSRLDGDRLWFQSAGHIDIDRAANLFYYLLFKFNVLLETQQGGHRTPCKLK